MPLGAFLVGWLQCCLGTASLRRRGLSQNSPCMSAYALAPWKQPCVVIGRAAQKKKEERIKKDEGRRKKEKGKVIPPCRCPERSLTMLTEYRFSKLRRAGPGVTQLESEKEEEIFRSTLDVPVISFGIIGELIN